MENEEYAIAYKEVSEILKYIPIFDYEKIPREKIELYKKMQDRDYHFKYSLEISISSKLQFSPSFNLEPIVSRMAVGCSKISFNI